LEVMERDAKKMRGARPFVFTNLKTGQGLSVVIRFVIEQGTLGTSSENNVCRLPLLRQWAASIAATNSPKALATSASAIASSWSPTYHSNID
jgi:hypothetical protein